MVLLNLLAVFGFMVVLAGCNVSDDVKQKVEMIRTDLAQLKDDIALFRKTLVLIGHQLQPCKPPAKHSDITCHYKLEILTAINKDKGLYQGRVPNTVIDEANAKCKDPKNNTHPELCVSDGDTNPYTFTINGSTTYDVGNVVECTNDPKNYDPNPNHLNCTLAQAMKKI